MRPYYHISDDNSDDGTEDYDNDKAVQQMGRKSSPYYPNKDSPLYHYLHRKKAKIHGAEGRDKKRQWFPPDMSPLSKEPDSDNYCWANCWIYHFDPMNQFGTLLEDKINFKDYCCLKCNKKGTLESKGWAFRLIIDYTRNIWILYQRLQCKN